MQLNFIKTLLIGSFSYNEQTDVKLNKSKDMKKQKKNTEQGRTESAIFPRRVKRAN